MTRFKSTLQVLILWTCSEIEGICNFVSNDQMCISLVRSLLAPFETLRKVSARNHSRLLLVLLPFCWNLLACATGKLLFVLAIRFFQQFFIFADHIQPLPHAKADNLASYPFHWPSNDFLISRSLLRIPIRRRKYESNIWITHSGQLMTRNAKWLIIKILRLIKKISSICLTQKKRHFAGVHACVCRIAARKALNSLHRVSVHLANRNFRFIFAYACVY